MGLDPDGSGEEPLVAHVRETEEGTVRPADWASEHAASLRRLLAPALAAQSKLRSQALGKWFSATRARRRARDEGSAGASALLGVASPGDEGTDGGADDGSFSDRAPRSPSVPSAGPSPAASEAGASRSEEERGSFSERASGTAGGSGCTGDEEEEGGKEEDEEKEEREEEEEEEEDEDEEELENMARARVEARAAGEDGSDAGSGSDSGAGEGESEDSEDAERRARIERERQSRQLRSSYFFNRTTQAPPPARGGLAYSATRAPSFRRLGGRRRGAGSLLHRMREVTQDRAAAIQRRRSSVGGAGLVFDGGHGGGGRGLIRLPGGRRAARMPGRGLVRAAMQGRTAGGGGEDDEDEDEDDDGVLGPGGGALAKRRGVRMSSAHVRAAHAKELSGVGGAAATSMSLTARELAAAPSAAARAGLLILDDNGHAMLERAHRMEATVNEGEDNENEEDEGAGRRRLGDAVLRGARATQLVRAQPRMYPRDTGPSVDPLPVASRRVDYGDSGLRFDAECFKRGRTHGEAQVRQGRALSPPARRRGPPPKGVYVPAEGSSSDEGDLRPPPAHAAPESTRGGDDSDEDTSRVISVTERHEMKMRRRTQAVERRRARLAAEMPWRLWTLGHPLEPRSTMARGEQRALRFAARRRREVVRKRAEEAAAATVH